MYINIWSTNLRDFKLHMQHWAKRLMWKRREPDCAFVKIP